MGLHVQDRSVQPGIGNVLEVENLRIYYYTDIGVVRAVDGVSFSIGRGEILGVVGESGSGKSTLGLAIGRLLPNNARIVDGRIVFDGRDITRISEDELRKIRGKELAYIFQDPHRSLNPVMVVGDQAGEVLYYQFNVRSKHTILARVIEAFRKVRISDADKRYHSYPHELSGGMKQRVVIATALIGRPKLIVADEPTSALDVTIQRQLINLLMDIREEYGTSIMLISHDLGVVSELSDSVSVMYAGKIVELGRADAVTEDPLHPYTQALVRSVPRIDEAVESLYSIPGSPPNLANPPAGCRFHPRCPYAREICSREEPPFRKIGDRYVACHLAG